MHNYQNHKIKSEHLYRTAYLYVRQSTLKQVYEHTESSKRQYALKERIIALGWDSSQVITIDEDLGVSGASTSEREGFKRLVSDVATGTAGLVCGIEVSRLARSSADWSRLMEICALTNTLIMDEDGIYDINDFNDRLLLGLKGTMSEAELHYLKSRMLGGLLSKAKRGELKKALPIGFLYDEENNIIKDPDQQVQFSIDMFFKIYKRTGSSWSTLKEYNRHYNFPKKEGAGFKNGELTWIKLTKNRVLHILHNPHYAGVYFYGRSKTLKTPHGKSQVGLPQEKWHVFIPDAHPSYITIEEYEANQKTMADNYRGQKGDNHNTAPREGPALLQGIVYCGICGEKMITQYHKNGKPRYLCREKNIDESRRTCQSIKGLEVDQEISRLLLKTVTPLAMEIALSVQEELLRRKNEIEKMYLQNIERARYEADIARRRYMLVDPENRLVAGTLEASWNIKLQELRRAEEEYIKECNKQKEIIDQKSKNDIMTIASDFEAVWNNPNVPDREKKRIVRLLIEDVTLVKGQEEISIKILFKGGATCQTSVDRSKKVCEKWATKSGIIKEIDHLLDSKKTSEIVEILNNKGFVTGKGQMFTKKIINDIIYRYQLETRYDRLRKKGLLTLTEVAALLNISKNKVKELRDENIIKAYNYMDSNAYLYELNCDVNH